MKHLIKTSLLLAILLFQSSCARSLTQLRPVGEGIDYVPILARERALRSKSEILLMENDEITTPMSIRPSVEITVVAKTDSTNLRLNYAGQVIFNWERNPNNLRINGGPADGRHLPGAGQIPVNEFVTIRWVVTPKLQEIWVNGKERYSHRGDYSKINNPVSVYPAFHSKVTVKSLVVRELKETANYSVRP